MDGLRFEITKKTKFRHLLELDSLGNDEMIGWLVEHAKPEDIEEEEFVNALLDLDVIDELPRAIEQLKAQLQRKATLPKRRYGRS